jgi:predicted CoA-substrate-specific enzyme activase
MVNASIPMLGLGLDAGSVAFKLVITDNHGRLLEQYYTRTHGRPVATALQVLNSVMEKHGPGRFGLVAGTGSAGRLICELLGIPFVNEVICQATAIRALHPQVRTLIEMGGQDSKLIFLPEFGVDGRPMVDFAMNTNCAAGTGSFLDQQASRLGVRIEGEFGQFALKSTNPPRVAGRCSVFAKSDMIHLQQQAAPVHDIVAGLCMGLARNLKSNLGRGRQLAQPIAFCGGVAANKGVVHALEVVFELGEGGLVVPECHACTGALGGLLVTLKDRQRLGESHGRPAHGRIDLEPLRHYVAQPHTIGNRIEALRPPSGGEPDGAILGRAALEARVRAQGEPVNAWLGLDVGSISTKAAVIDENHKVLAKIYLMTAGRPLDAVRRVLKEIGEQCCGLVHIRGAATTGSGRYLTGNFIGADLVINEITAQATAAAVIDPLVDTIFEIGGQDSKYISLDDGVVVDFEMNHACAAGTGSFLEEQAERLGISIKKQFADLAFSSAAPIRLGERCTVFMESDLVSCQQQGAQTHDLAAGLAYSIVSNYINRVVGHRRIGKRIFFQGGTAFNEAVVAAFEKFTGRRITVPPHHEVTGAIGAAVLARRHQERLGRTTSSFGGFDLANVEYTIRSFECEHCSNNCEINEVTIVGREPLYCGSRCDRYNFKKETTQHEAIPNLFAERARLLFKHAGLKKEKIPGRPTIGIPLALTNHQLLPFWGRLLTELELNVVVSAASTPRVVRRGVEAVLSTPCFPVKVAHGHVLELIDKGVEYLWVPSIVTMKRDNPENRHNQPCPYITALPYQLAAALEPKHGTVKMLRPPVRFDLGERGLFKALKGLCSELRVSTARLKQAIAKATRAQEEFEEACRSRGREILAQLRPEQRAVVIVSRPYNGCDLGVCLDMPSKLRKLNVLPIPMDFLDLRADQSSNDRVLRRMYWKYGQRILRAAQIIREDSRLHAVYLSNFGCGPDSFLLSYFKHLMAPKPSLVLEIDEHSADAGVVTRLEAFLESVSNAPVRPLRRALPLYPIKPLSHEERTLYIPWMGDEAYPVAAAFRGCGQPAEVIPLADQQSIEIGRRSCSGKECLPCIITVGDMLRVSRRPGFDPAKSAFFMPGSTGPCRFGQYNALHRLILDENGLQDVPVIAPSQDAEMLEDWSRMFEQDPMRLAWCGVVAVDLLQKSLLSTRPYETQPGTTDLVYGRWLGALCSLIETKPLDEQFVPLLTRAAADFAAVATEQRGRRPRIGIVGEIYVRRHAFANNNLVRQLEQLGAQTFPAGFPEWIYYCNDCRKHEFARDWAIRPWLVNWFTNQVQWKIQSRFARPFQPLLAHVREPKTAELLDLARPFVHDSFVGGDTVLSVGKMVEFGQTGCHGVINVMPFSCMPSTIVDSMIKKISASLGDMPAISISYDGQQDPMLTTRLEAFIHQARAFQANRSEAHGSHAMPRQPATSMADIRP